MSDIQTRFDSSFAEESLVCLERRLVEERAALAKLEMEFNKLELALAIARDDLAAMTPSLDADAAGTQVELALRVAELQALRRSWSWRLTGPVRALGRLVGYRGRR